MNRKQEVTEEIKQNTAADPFIQEFKEDGFRNLDEPAEEATDTYQHEVTQAIKADLSQEQKGIETALNRMKDGTYGKCEVCGKQIPEERLKINPTATKCVDCERKSSSTK